MREITDLNELKKIELDIMKHIHAFCEENDIKYVLCFGTLIGAVRHQGFIPWDDDIDIYMFREDYEKFRRLFPEYGQKHKLYIAASDTTPCLPRAMAKVCDARTKLIEPINQYSDDIGVFVDIWPLDGTPSSKIGRFFWNKKILFAHRLFYSGIEKDEYFQGKGLKKVLRKLCKIIGPLKVEQYIEKKAHKYPVKSDRGVECYSNKIRGFTYEEFNGRHLVKFEDVEFYIPDHYDSILKKIYGDYMKLPPKEQQIPHHVINTFWID